MQIISKLKEGFTVLKVPRNGSDRNTTYGIEGNNRSLEPTTMTGEHPADQSFTGKVQAHFGESACRIHTYAMGIRVT